MAAGAGEAIPQLKGLNAQGPRPTGGPVRSARHLDPDQRAGVEAYTASDCTAVAVARFIEGMDAYDDIRKRFLAWRDWGATGMRSIRRLPVRQLLCSRRRSSSSGLTAPPDRWRKPTILTATPRKRPTWRAPELSRRALLGAAAAGAAGFVVGRVAGPLFPHCHPKAGIPGLGGDGIGRLSVLRGPSSRGGHAATEPRPFRGLRHARWNQPRDLTDLLRDWSDAAACMTQGLPIQLPESSRSDPDAPRDDTGKPGSAGERSDRHDRDRTGAVRARRRRPLRHRRGTTTRTATPAVVRRRRVGDGLERR